MKVLYFSDVPDKTLNDMLDFCNDHKLSLAKYENTDVSDVSGQWDTVAAFVFTDDDDAILFTLKYSGG